MAAPPAIDLLEQKMAESGFDPHVRAGIIANVMHESGGDPEAIGDLSENDSVGSRGLAQWRGDRLTALVDYARETGRQGRDPEVQAEFLIRELSSMPNTLKRLQEARSPEAAAFVFMKEYERPKYLDPERSRTAAAVAAWQARKGAQTAAVQPPAALQAVDRAVEPYTRPMGRGIQDVADLVESGLAHLGVGPAPEDVKTTQQAREAEYQVRGEENPLLRNVGRMVAYGPLLAGKVAVAGAGRAAAMAALRRLLTGR